MPNLTGQNLTIALSRTSQPIVLQDSTGTRVGAFADVAQPGCVTFPLVELFTYLARGYEVYGTKRRARYIRPPKPKAYRDERIFLTDTHHWDDRACLRYWSDQRSAEG